MSEDAWLFRRLSDLASAAGGDRTAEQTMGTRDGLKAAISTSSNWRCKMFRIIFPNNTGTSTTTALLQNPMRSTHNKVHYIRKGRTCIASMFRFNHDFEPVNKADADRG